MKNSEQPAKQSNDTADKSEIRLLTAGEIECRIGTISAKGVSLLLFKDARADQKILDETYGAMGWKRTHQSIDGNLYCTVEVWDSHKKEWIAKQDVGTASYTEKEKGQASDSFKRACVNWGIGRELYTAPFIWIPAQKAAIKEKDGKYACYDKFTVSSIAFNGRREISALVIVNQDGREVYALSPAACRKTETQAGSPAGKNIPAAKNSAAGQKQTASKNIEPSPKGVTASQMKQMEKELTRTDVDLSAVLERYRLQDAGEMTAEIYESAMKSLKKTRPKTAA